jgi:hypothetical protein
VPLLPESSRGTFLSPPPLKVYRLRWVKPSSGGKAATSSTPKGKSPPFRKGGGRWGGFSGVAPVKRFLQGFPEDSDAMGADGQGRGGAGVELV